MFVQNCEGSKILLYLQANKLANHSFTDVSKRPNTLGSETRTLFLMAQWAAWTQWLGKLSWNPTRATTQNASGEYYAHNWGNQSLRNHQPNNGLLANLPIFCPGNRNCLYYSGQETNLPLSLMRDTISVFQSCLLCKHFWRESGAKLSIFAQKRKRNTSDPWRIAF